MSTSALSAVAAAASVALLVPGRPGRDADPDARRTSRYRAGGRRIVLGGAVVVGVLLLGGWLPVRRVVLVLVLGAAGVAAGRLVGQRGRRREAAATRERVLEVCEELAAELGAGRTTSAALARAAEQWPALAGVAEADRLGSDVPQAWRKTARRPGAEGLLTLAAAWHVAHRTGQGLGAALERVARDLRARRSLRRVVDGELASARSTARLVAALPLLALVMGSGAGGDPWGFLLDTPAGLACLGGGLALGSLGLAWIEAIASGVESGRG